MIKTLLYNSTREILLKGGYIKMHFCLRHMKSGQSLILTVIMVNVIKSKETSQEYYAPDSHH